MKQKQVILKSQTKSILDVINNFYKPSDNTKNGFIGNEEIQKGVENLLNLCERKAILELRIVSKKVCVLCKQDLEEKQTYYVNKCENLYHAFHKTCLINHGLKISSTTKNLQKCPELNCLNQLDAPILSILQIELKNEEESRQFIEEYKAEDQRRKQESQKFSQFKCDICWNEGKVEEICRTLDCLHRVCANCLSTKIIEDLKNNSQKFTCLTEGCNKPINFTLIEDLAKTFQFKDLLDTQSEERITMMKLKQNEILVKCTGYLITDQKTKQVYPFKQPDTCTRLRLGLNLSDLDQQKLSMGDINPCKAVYIRNTQDNIDTIFACQRCLNEFCTNGCDDAHQGFTCQQFQQWRRENSQADALIQEIIKKEGIKACRKCGAQCLQVSGCNHVTCSACQFYFCWNCLGPAHALGLACVAAMA